VRYRTLVLLVLVLACAAVGPVPLQWGKESCRHCHMTLADRRFGAEVITTRGRVLSFDDAGCAAEHLGSEEVAAAEVSSVWVIDYDHPDSLIAAGKAVFVRSSGFRTPMGSGVVATEDSVAAISLARLSDGRVMRWSEVLAAAKAGELRPH
jgi:copper chaperone NosL